MTQANQTVTTPSASFNPADTGIDWRGVGSRIEMIVDTLSRCYVAEGFKVDRAAGAKAAEYCQRRAAGKVGHSPRAERDIQEFAARHGQSLDWILEGDVAALLCTTAAGKHATGVTKTAEKVGSVAWRAAADMEEPLSSLDRLLSALYCVGIAVGSDGHDAHARAIVGLHDAMERHVKAAEALRCKAFKLTHPYAPKLPPEAYRDDEAAL